MGVRISPVPRKEKMKLLYLWNGLRDQLPFSRLIKNLLKGHVLGLFHKRSHWTESGKEKVGYNTKETAMKVSAKMAEKHNKHFSNYRCIFCGKYHLGKNRDNK